MIEASLERPAERNVAGGSPAGALAAALVDQVECGVLACGVLGEVFHANIAARRELDDGRTLRLSDDCVRCAGNDQDLWLEVLRDAAVRGRSRLEYLGQGEDRLPVSVMPIRLGDAQAATVVVLFGRRQLCSPLGLEMLASNHGLTYSEGRVLRALICNRTPREIAASHGVTVSTVRTQIQAVRAKMGVRSIDALLLRAAEMPPVTAYQ